MTVASRSESGATAFNQGTLSNVTGDAGDLRLLATAGPGLRFPSRSDTIVVGNDLQLRSDDDITIEIWFRAPKNNQWAYLIDTRAGGGGFWLAKRGDDNRIGFSGGPYIPASAWTDGELHVVTVTASSTETRIYLDGTHQATGGSRDRAAFDLVRLANNQNDSEAWDGDVVGEIRIWKGIVSDTYIQFHADMDLEQTQKEYQDLQQHTETNFWTSGDSLTQTVNNPPVARGSETLTANGSTLERGVDYFLDYEAGEVTFAETPSASVDITYYEIVNAWQLWARWGMDEGEGTTIYDQMSFDFNATLTGGEWVDDGFESYAREGYRIGPALDFSNVNRIESTSVDWLLDPLPDRPELTNMKVEVSIDGGNIWEEIESPGDPIPQLAKGTLIFNGELLYRQTLWTEDTLETPNLAEFSVTIEGKTVHDHACVYEVTEVTGQRSIHYRAEVQRPNGTWEDLTDFTESIDIDLGDMSAIGTGSTGADAVVRTASIVLRQDTENRLVPTDRASSWNQVNSTYTPLLWPNRRIRVEVAITDQGVIPGSGDWTRLFEGYLGDGIGSNGHLVTLECRDLSKRLQDRYIWDERTYGSENGTPAEEVIQQILDDEFGAGVIELLVPSSPGFGVLPYAVHHKTVWDAIQEVVAVIGWWLGYRWHPQAEEFRLTLLEPPRGVNESRVNAHLSWDQLLYRHDLDITDRDIRNQVSISYEDVVSGNLETIVAKNQSSIDEFGLRAMEIIEADTELIRRESEAARLAELALEDLAYIPSQTNIQIPLSPKLDLFDSISVEDPRQSDQTEWYGIESIRHTLRPGRLRTEVVASGSIRGSHRRWLNSEARPGAYKMITKGELEEASVGNGKVEDEAVDTGNLVAGAISDHAETVFDADEPVQTSSSDWVEIGDMQTRIDVVAGSVLFVFFRADVLSDTSLKVIDTRLRIDGVDYHRSRVTLPGSHQFANIVNAHVVRFDQDKTVLVRVFWRRERPGIATMESRQVYALLLKR